MNVLTTCGHTVGLKQSPSVVFSSSSDLAVEKQGAGQQPSSEEASLAEGLTNEPGKDELEPQQVRSEHSFSISRKYCFTINMANRNLLFSFLGDRNFKLVSLKKGMIYSPGLTMAQCCKQVDRIV